MHRTVKSYYMDEPLNRNELSEVEWMLSVRETGAEEVKVRIEQVRIPHVLPAPTQEGHYPEPLETYVEIARRNLKRAGIRADCGRQVAWVLPREFHWAGVFQAAIFEETGFYPMAVQRWNCTGGGCERGEVRIVDGQALAGMP